MVRLDCASFNYQERQASYSETHTHAHKERESGGRERERERFQVSHRRTHAGSGTAHDSGGLWEIPGKGVGSDMVARLLREVNGYTVNVCL